MKLLRTVLMVGGGVLVVVVFLDVLTGRKISASGGAGNIIREWVDSMQLPEADKSKYNDGIIEMPFGVKLA